MLLLDPKWGPPNGSAGDNVFNRRTVTDQVDRGLLWGEKLSTQHGAGLCLPGEPQLP